MEGYGINREYKNVIKGREFECSETRRQGDFLTSRVSTNSRCRHGRFGCELHIAPTKNRSRNHLLTRNLGLRV
jgi:hypothetical protein